MFRKGQVGSITKYREEVLTPQAARREARPRSASPSSEASSEDGEISHYDSRRHSRSPSSPRKPKRKEIEENTVDITPPDYLSLNSARLSRYEIVDMMFKDGFEEVAKGAYVRLMAKEVDQQGRPKYRAHRIVREWLSIHITGVTPNERDRAGP